ncbi:MAG: hypothetical protein DHS20C15_28970 [Planctomycetota bacterium]|nr:MAG: hypothetical protein DHS20C15_28970 [Planctomycetota bacterium]
MLEMLKRHAPLICALLLLWSAHSLVAEEISVEARGEAALPVFMDELLLMRDPELAAQQLTDPFRNEVNLQAPPPDPDPATDASDDELDDADSAGKNSSAPVPVSEALPLPDGLELNLESLVDTGDARSSARINGQLVRVGDQVRGWEPANEAPRVTSIEGTSVVLRFQDTTHILNFNGRSSAHLMRRPGTAQQGGRPSVASGAEAPISEGDTP